MAFFFLSDYRPNDLAFDSNEWKQADTRLRGQMTGDLIKSKILERKSRQEVLQLLGSGDREGFGFVSYEIKYGNALDKIIRPGFQVIVLLRAGIAL